MSQTVASFTLGQKDTKAALEVALKADTPTIVTSSPGIGKSAIIHGLAAEYNLKVIDMRLSQLMPYDLMGYPKEVEGKMKYIPLSEIPIAGEPLPKKPDGTDYDGFLLFLDELNSGDKYVQGAAYKLVLDRKVGEHDLHENCKVLAAGNRAIDKALVNKLVSPMKSRLCHIEMHMNIGDFIEYVSDQCQLGNWHTDVGAFLNFKPDASNDFNPEIDVITYACPRTWEMLSDQLNAGLEDLGADIYMPIIAGIVGENAGSQFCDFLAVKASLPSLKEIENDPAQCTLPDEIAAKWALGSYLADKVNSTNEQAVVTYLERITEGDLKVVVYRMIMANYPNIMRNKSVVQSMGSIRTKLSKIK